MDKMIESSKQVSLFCRLNLNTRRDLPIRSSEMGMLIYLVKTDEVKNTPCSSPILSCYKSHGNEHGYIPVIQGIHREKTIENRQAQL